MAPNLFGQHGKDYEKIRKSQELLNRIFAMLKPHVEEIIRPLLLREMGVFQGLTEEEKQYFAALPESASWSAEYREMFREWKEAVLNAQPFTSEEVEEEIGGAVKYEVCELIKSWSGTFVLGKLSDDGIYYVEAQKISDAMLPALDEKTLTLVCEQFVSYASYLDGSQFMDILRHVRSSLPAGKVLPDEMVELLALLFHVKIV